MKKGYYKGQELTMSELGLSLEELSGQPLELYAREGARLLLTVALEEEVPDFLKRRPYERSQGNVRGYRNGHRERQVSCGAGEIEVAVLVAHGINRKGKRVVLHLLYHHRPVVLRAVLKSDQPARNESSICARIRLVINQVLMKRLVIYIC